MKLKVNFIEIACILFIILSILSVCSAAGGENAAEVQEPAKASSHASKSGHSAASSSVDGLPAYFISFLDDATDKNVQDVTKWLQERNIRITDSVSESYIRFIVARMLEEDGKHWISASS